MAKLLETVSQVTGFERFDLDLAALRFARGFVFAGRSARLGLSGEPHLFLKL
jgi:hypothetical protein